ncbi:fluoride efflux transporter FluC [Weissella minor]|uniref:Fluoride-specific ion channel n=1 Tax=Weissella minor TaxID=1620 RepID=A0A0R2JFX8_9LACO|nr:CrcB family protein [Weissella minor]KRN76241.1 hypothetical protein IV67_GL000817 [Weissella minor]
MMLIIVAGIGAAIGSMARFTLLEMASKLMGSASGLMVLIINLLAALVAGIVYGIHAPLLDNTFLAAGIIGGFSTFSAPIVDLADGLSAPGQSGYAILRMAVLLIGGLLIFQVGVLLTKI